MSIDPAEATAVRTSANPSRNATLLDHRRVSESSAQPARILLVDDDASMRHMVASYLEEHNTHVVSAWQKQDVTRQFVAVEPDLVILDLRLGQEDGLDLLRDIRSRSDIPVIITSGHRRDEIDRVVGLELGADHAAQA